ncbi:hypothetical protein [Accumulibacter sp.]|uniref:hypothetical protein n=1 Tax=Accumulibacter sp. TaxID=2053492 RepID=UPI0025FB7DC3|nr:hypothetical protein [Accumulibacter sp.]MCM8595683.1 hypothetical protein [Accumulibacter sp.]MCM8627757.1 hypothetical protein [Accumulibacter sp.]MDS4049830.1 hypothetical protein [Accumulibacter sp.]
MRLSPFFEDLKAAYDAELEDLTTDSAGHDVLRARLQIKRRQLAEILPMIEYSPEMVAVVFHGGLRFARPEVIGGLAGLEPEALPSWSELRGSVELEPWAEELARIVLDDPGGDRFLVVTACLEYLQSAVEGQAGAPRDVDEVPQDDRDDAGQDLEEAGADWLAEQGFDRRSGFPEDRQ